jgi:hypothetical protein
VPAKANWAYTQWGMTPEQVAAASSGAVQVLPSSQRTRNDVDRWEMAAKGTYKDGSLTMDAGFTFDTQHGGLTCVMYNVRASDWPAASGERQLVRSEASWLLCRLIRFSAHRVRSRGCHTAIARRSG